MKQSRCQIIKTAILLICWIALSSHTLFAQENYRIVSVKFQGNNFFSSSALKDLMILKPPKGFKKIFPSKNAALYSKHLLNNDLLQIINFYQQEGFINASISEHNIHADDKKQTVVIQITIKEEKPVKVDSINFKISENNNPDFDKIGAILKKTLSTLRLNKGDRFRDADLLHDMERLETACINEGYPYTEIDYKLDVLKENYNVNINFLVNSGPLCYFGNIEINGNDKIKEKYIRKQIAFKPNQVFNRNLVDKSQEQIYHLNVFQIASVKAIIQKDKSELVPVQILVREAPRFTTKIGMGYGLEDKFRALLDMQYLRFLGGTRRFNIYVRHSALEPFHINSKIIQPAFIDPTTSLGLNPYYRRQEEVGYKLTRKGVNLYVQKQIGRVYNTGVTFNSELVKLDTTSVANRKLDTELDDLYNKSSVLFSISQNRTNDLFSPTEGYNNGMTLKYCGFGESEYHYAKILIDLRGFIPFYISTLALRSKFGRILSMDAAGFIPVEDRFFSGGSNSTRGWGRHQLGPKDENKRPLGGNSLFEASLELRTPLYKSFSTVLFWDFGNVWSDKPNFTLDDLRHSAGIGFRVFTPIGPIRFDFAQPIFDDEKHIQFHFSIGEAF